VSSRSAPPPQPVPPPSPTGTPLVPEGQSAGTGDIPDNQVFLSYASHVGGWSLRYPEGWARRNTGHSVTFRDKDNVARVLVESGAAPGRQGTTRALTQAGARVQGVGTVQIAGGPVLRVTYRTRGPSDPVTGRRIVLTVDRYIYPHGSRHAILDLGTPVGVDNVDAYRLISRSFRWR
jgi:hypothetical protein